MGLWAVLFVACGGTENHGGRLRDAGSDGSDGNESGGASASGGTSASGGNASGGKSTGGRPASGGSVSGGASTTGGASSGGAGGESATGGTSNTGGAATGGAPGCQGEDYPLKSDPVDAYIMFDQSSSMSEAVPAPGTGTWWTAAAAGLTAFVKDPAAAGTGVGLQYFPLNGVSPNSCTAPYSTPAVAIAPLPANANALSASIAAHSPTTFTPTGPALAGAIAHMKAWAPSHPGRVPVVVLVTDGFPTECEPQQIPDIAVLAKNAFETSPSVRTAVIGLNLGAGRENLSQIPKAGGTDRAIFIDSGTIGGTISASFATILLNTVQESFTCSFPVPTAQGKPIDFDKVNVRYAAGTEKGTLHYVQTKGDCLLNQDQGWYYDKLPAPTKIMLCPYTCQQRLRTYHMEVGCERLDGAF
jgi:hypothetical protein